MDRVGSQLEDLVPNQITFNLLKIHLEKENYLGLSNFNENSPQAIYEVLHEQSLAKIIGSFICLLGTFQFQILNFLCILVLIYERTIISILFLLIHLFYIFF